MTLVDLNDWIVRTWHESTGLLVLAGGVCGLLALAAVLIYARVSQRPIRPAVIWSASNLALLLNAEGMWRIAVTTLDLPKGFAVLVFAVFEVALMVAMSLAGEQYQRTTERDADGKITKPGHPGKMLYVAWMIALLSGVVVASNAPTLTEVILRLALPIIVVTMWWATMTAEGQTRRRGRFAYSPTRLLERYGLLTPDEDPDYERMARDRRTRAMVTYAHRLETGVVGAGWHEWRLTRLARTADEAMADQVAEQVDRAVVIVNRVVPSRRQSAPADAPVDALTLGDDASADAPVEAGLTLPLTRQSGVTDASGLALASVSPTVLTRRQPHGERVNGARVLASAGVGRRASASGASATVGSTNERQPERSTRTGAPVEEARQRYLDSVSDGRPLTGRQLGAMYGRSESWGRTVIAGAKAADASAGALADASTDASAATQDDVTDERTGQ